MSRHKSVRRVTVTREFRPTTGSSRDGQRHVGVDGVGLSSQVVHSEVFPRRYVGGGEVEEGTGHRRRGLRRESGNVIGDINFLQRLKFPVFEESFTRSIFSHWITCDPPSRCLVFRLRWRPGTLLDPYSERTEGWRTEKKRRIGQ